MTRQISDRADGQRFVLFYSLYSLLCPTELFQSETVSQDLWQSRWPRLLLLGKIVEHWGRRVMCYGVPAQARACIIFYCRMED